MPLRIWLALGFVAVAALVALVLEARRKEPPVRSGFELPRQLDRTDFPRADAPFLVALFSSVTCGSCSDLAAKVAVLESPAVATCDVSFQDRRDLHERYDISGVPMVVLADHEGVVRAGFVGPTTATDLWAALAELRAPGSTPEPGLGALD